MYEQLLVHLVGDYFVQTDAMASKKTSSSGWALLHAFTYTLLFLLLTNSLFSLSLIFVTHYFIDRYRLVRYLIFAKNWITNHTLTWASCKGTGYPDSCPPWLAVWLMIISDNVLHLVINYIALKYL